MEGQMEANAGQAACPEPARPRRLIGLWLICVLFGLAGMVDLAFVFLAKPLGILVFGGLALISFTLAVGLWVRSNVVRIVTIVLLALGCIASAIPFARDPQEFAPLSVPLCVGVSILAYLWLRRKCFKVPREEKPRRVGAAGAAGLAIAVLFGVAFTLLLTVDDSAQEFPRLAVDRTPVPDEDNAFVVLRRMIEDWPAWEDDETEILLYEVRAAWYENPDQWRAKAKEVIGEWESCLATTDEMLSRPRFAPPVPATFWEATESGIEWLGRTRELARRILLQSKFQLIEGRPEKAMATAQKIVDLGLMLSEQNDSLLTYLVGKAILSLGLEQIREVAASPGIAAELLAPAIGKLRMAEALRRGMARALAQESAQQRLLYQSLKNLDWVEELDVPQGLDEEDLPDSRWARHLFADSMPLVKMNMTMNMLEGYLEELLDRTDRYEPFAAEPQPEGFWDVVASVGLIHFLRNPIPDVFSPMLLSAGQRTVEEHFRGLADVRLTRLFLALRCYQLEHGALPDSLGELAPGYFEQVPLDPFAEEPFRYEPAGDAPRLYSVGPDQQPAPDAEDTDDIVIELTFAHPDNKE